MNLKQKIEILSKQVGFDYVGFVKTDFLLKYYDYLIQWLREGYHAQMQYMANEPWKRVQPKYVFENVSTIIVFLKSYFTREKPLQKKYKIAKYAYYVDYHKLIKEKIEIIGKTIQQSEEDFSFRAVVDTAPILEKAAAVEAGLGWWGKNSLLVTKKGSYFFIGLMLINKSIEFEQKLSKNFCGSCNRCINACPTRAIVKPYVIDSNKCISYLTIEKKGTFNNNEQLYNWIFGCDVCQEVCPWNNFSINSDLPLSQEIIHFNDIDWENITEEQFNNFFKKTPLKRAKYEGIKRNIQQINFVG